MRPLYPVKPPRQFLEQHHNQNSHINRYTALAEFPQLPPPTPVKREATPGTSKQSLNSYAKRIINSYSEAVQPQPPIKQEQASSSTASQQKFDWINSQQVPIIAIERKLVEKRITDIIKSCYTDRNYVETDNPYKTREFYEAILIATNSIEIENELADKNDPRSIRYSKFTIKRILSPADWPVDHLHTPIQFPLSVNFKISGYNFYDYKNAWCNFIYLRPGSHSWSVKFCEKVSTDPIPRWFYEWWNTFGADERVLSHSFKQLHTNYQKENEELAALPEHIQLCKFFMAKRVSYIISWEFNIEVLCKVRYLVKTIKIKGWTPKNKEKQVQQVQTKIRSTDKLSKEALKRKLQQALANLDQANGSEINQITELLHTASSTASAGDNGDMEDPQGIAQAYLTDF